MKPFSKMAAIGEKKPVVTRSGKKVTIIGEVPADVEYPVVGYIEGREGVDTWTSDGSHNVDSGLDLFMKTETHEGWVAFGQNCDQPVRGLIGFSTHVWLTEEAAKKSFKVATGLEASGTQKVSWEI